MIIAFLISSSLASSAALDAIFSFLSSFPKTLSFSSISQIRSLRLVIDPGIHYYGWDYQKCFDISKKYLTNHTDEEIDKTILRYMNMPGQAITYKLGEKAFLYIREKLLKSGFNIKDIHEIMLESGPCPLEFFVNLV